MAQIIKDDTCVIIDLLEMITEMTHVQYLICSKHGFIYIEDTCVKIDLLEIMADDTCVFFDQLETLNFILEMTHVY